MTATTDRRGRNLPFDSHMHTELSHDSSVPIDVYARQAVELGIGVIAITDHIDFEPGFFATGYSSFEQREHQVRDAAERWGPQGLTIRFGVEVTYDRAWEDDIREHLRTHAYDFAIGSVHNAAESPYRAANVASWVAGKTLAEIVAPSFGQVTAAAQSELFDAIGHIDNVKRFLFPHIQPSQFADAPELYEPILHALVESGTALEVNTSGWRHPVGESYPSPAIVARFRELGGERVTVGSDAHGADHFAWALGDGYAAAEAVGLVPKLPPRR